MRVAPGPSLASARCSRQARPLLRPRAQQQSFQASPRQQQTSPRHQQRYPKPNDQKFDAPAPTHHHQQQQHQQLQHQPVVAARDAAGNAVVRLSKHTDVPAAAGSLVKCLAERPYLQLLYTSLHPVFIAARVLALANLMQASVDQSVFFVPTLVDELIPEGERRQATTWRWWQYTAHVYTEPLSDVLLEGSVRRVQEHATDWRVDRKARGVNEERAHDLADVLYAALEEEGDAVVVADTHSEVTTAMHAAALCNRRIALEGHQHMLGCTVLRESSLRKGGRPGRLLFLAEKRVMPSGGIEAAPGAEAAAGSGS